MYFTYRLHPDFLVNLENQLFVGHQSSIACKVMLSAFDLCRRTAHGGEGQFAQICQNAWKQKRSLLCLFFFISLWISSSEGKLRFLFTFWKLRENSAVLIGQLFVIVYSEKTDWTVSFARAAADFSRETTTGQKMTLKLKANSFDSEEDEHCVNCEILEEQNRLQKEIIVKNDRILELQKIQIQQVLDREKMLLAKLESLSKYFETVELKVELDKLLSGYKPIPTKKSSK